MKLHNMYFASVSGIPKMGGGGFAKKIGKKNSKKLFFSLEKIFLIPEKFCPALQN